MTAQQISNSFVIEIDGKALPDDVDVASVFVEDHLHLPDSFSLTFSDGARTAITKSGAKVGAAVKISVQSDAAPKPQVLVTGEVTALEAEIHGGTSYTMVRGYDQSHQLFRGRSTASYCDMTYSDVAEKVAQRNKLKKGTIDSTSTTHAHITQSNETNWQFLNRLARDVGFEVAVSDGKLHFRKPIGSSGAPGPADLSGDDALALLVGSNLLNVRAHLTATDQVKDVEVRAWDSATKQAFKSTVAASTDVAKNASSPAKMASAFPGSPLVSTGVPYATAAEVEAAAKALSTEVASSFAELEGQARGNPKLRAGVAVRIGLLGDPFDGQYVLTSTRHSYDADEGYVTGFVISGRQERSLLGLTGGGGSDPNIIAGVVPALVDDIDDPKKLCRVKLRFPWMDDKFKSDWSRLVMPGAGKDRGLVVLPEVGDEVLVAFEQGDMRRPFVVGGLYNDKDTPKVGPGSLLDGSSKAVNNRLFTSRLGHQLVFIDADKDAAIVVSTADGKIEIRLDQAKSKLSLKCGGDVSIQADGNISIEAKKDLVLKGQKASMEGQSSLSAKAPQVTVEGSGPTQIKGKPLQLN